MKTILITGSTDGIGLTLAKTLVKDGHRVIVHGRSAKKVAEVSSTLGIKDSYVCDLSQLKDVSDFADRVASDHKSLDVLVNNAGVFQVDEPVTSEGLDVRFVVNTIAPYLLTKKLLPLLKHGRVVNLSSAAQARVDLNFLEGRVRGGAQSAYAQSKLAIAMWTKHFEEPPMMVSVNPASFLGSKMVKEAYGMNGGDLQIGADILKRASLSPEFKNAHGKYYDNDSKRFASLHPEALDSGKITALVESIEKIIAEKLPTQKQGGEVCQE